MHDPDFDPYQPPRTAVGDKAHESFETDPIRGNPFLTIWTRPRATIRGIVDTDPTRAVVLLAVLNGISSTLNQSLQKNGSNNLSLPAILGLSLFAGSIGGLIGNYLTGWLLRLTGSWIGGVADTAECRAAIAWGSVPIAVNLVLMLGLLPIFGANVLSTNDPDHMGMQKALTLILVGISQMVLGIWSMVLSIKSLAEVHRFSAWKGLGAFLLACLLGLGVILLVVVGFFAVMGITNTQ